MNDEHNDAVASFLCAAGRVKSPTSHTGARWTAAFASATGTRHVTEQRGCEDHCDVRTLPFGAMHVALADGVSAGVLGAEASTLAVAQCLAARPPYWLVPPEGNIKAYQQHLIAAEHHVHRALTALQQGRGAATLAAAWLSEQGDAYLSRVGDCRIYQWRWQGARVVVEPLFTDQSYANLGLTPQNGQPLSNPAHMVGLGTSLGAPEVIHRKIAVRTGLLLSSDGFHECMHEHLAQHLQAAFERPAATDLRSPAQRLVHAAQQAGSDDDISVLLVNRY